MESAAGNDCRQSTPSRRDGGKQLSIIVPLYNEEDNVVPLYEALVQVLDDIALDAEILFVDDGSRDDTASRAASLARRDPRLKVVKFRRNYGQTPAMAAGIDLARGEILITMDGDLQNDPADIPAFIDKINEGYDIVVGWRHKRQDKLITRKIPSRIANWLIGKVTGVPIKDNGCSLKAYRASVIKEVPLYSEMHRFIPAMSSVAGARIAEIKVRHHARRFGVSKYGLSRVYKVLLDLLAIKTIISFSARPFYWFVLLALPVAVLALVALAFTVRNFGQGDFTVVMPGLFVLFSTLSTFLLFSGALAELIYKTGDVDLYRLSSLTFEVQRPDATEKSLAREGE